MKTTKSRIQKSKQGKKDGRPSRPLNAYNIFFAIERRKIVAKQQKEAAMVGCTSTTSRRRREQAHVGFANLARIVSERWKTIDEGYKAELEEKARLDKIRYENEMKQWNSEKRRNNGDQTASVTNINTTFDTSSDSGVVGFSSAISSKASSRYTSKSMPIPKSCSEQHESKTDDAPARPRSSFLSRSLCWEHSFPSIEHTQEEPMACSTAPLPHDFYCAPCFTPVSTLSGEEQGEFSTCRRFPGEKRSIDGNTCKFDAVDTSRNPSGNRIIPVNPPRSERDEKNENILTTHAPTLQSSNSADVDYFDFEPLPYQHFAAATSSPAQAQTNIATRRLHSSQYDFNVTSVRNPIKFASYAHLGHCTPPLDLHHAQNERSGQNMKSYTTAGPILASDGYHFCDAPCTTQAQAYGYTYDFDTAATSPNPSDNISLIPANPPPRRYAKNGSNMTSNLEHCSSKPVGVGYFGFEQLPYQNFHTPFSAPAQTQANVATRSLPRNKDNLNVTFSHNSIEFGSYSNLRDCDPLDLHHTQDEIVSWGIKNDMDGYNLCHTPCDAQASAMTCKNSNKFTDASPHTLDHNEGVPTVQCIDGTFMTSPSQVKPPDLSVMSESVGKQSFHYHDSMKKRRSSMPPTMAASSLDMCDEGDPSTSSGYSIEEIQAFFVAVKRNSFG